jgi:hypothetical protein
MNIATLNRMATRRDVFHANVRAGYLVELPLFNMYDAQPCNVCAYVPAIGDGSTMCLWPEYDGSDDTTDQIDDEEPA